MLINEKEINLHIGRMAVEQYFTDRVNDTVDFGTFNYMPYEFALIISACASNYTRLNGGRKQVDRKELMEWIESDLTDEQTKELNEFCQEFLDSIAFKEKIASVNTALEDVKKKSLIGTDLEKPVTKRGSARKTMTVIK